MQYSRKHVESILNEYPSFIVLTRKFVSDFTKYKIALTKMKTYLNALKELNCINPELYSKEALYYTRHGKLSSDFPRKRTFFVDNTSLYEFTIKKKNLFPSLVLYDFVESIKSMNIHNFGPWTYFIEEYNTDPTDTRLLPLVEENNEITFCFSSLKDLTMAKLIME